MLKTLWRKIWLCFILLLTLQARGEEQKLIYLEHSNTLNFDEDRYGEAQLLRGNVRFRHEDVLMFCDSALYYEKENTFDAFGHVHFIQGDTIEGFGDVLYYDGNTKLARMRHNVRLVHTGTVLTTDSMNYDRRADIAWYYTGGEIRDSLNVLTSVWGQYTPYNKQALFRDSVLLVNERFVLTSDSLLYNTQTKIANLVSPTRILYEQETEILSSCGWYNTQTEESMLLKRSLVINDSTKSLTGDTIFYDKRLGHGEVRGGMEMADSVQKVTLYGEYGEVFEDQKRGYATDSALLIDRSSDDWMYMHADTLFTDELSYEVETDTTDTAEDSTYTLIRAYYGVRVYKTDMQMVCDSLRYNSRDSILYLYTDPVCWTEDQQISSDSILVYMRDGEVDYAHGFGSAIAVQQDDINQFNQLSGKEIRAYIVDGELQRMNVDGNAQTVFYPREEDGRLVGVNKTESSYVTIYFQNSKIDHILMTTSSSGVLYPLSELSESDAKLGNFFWAAQERPLVPSDVFLRPEKVPRPKGAVLSAGGK